MQMSKIRFFSIIVSIRSQELAQDFRVLMNYDIDYTKSKRKKYTSKIVI